MQKVAENATVLPLVAGFPLRVIGLVKHGVEVLFEQQACEMPPFASTQFVPDPLRQAVPVQAPSVQVPVSQSSDWSCGPALSPQGRAPVRGGASPVVSGSRMSSVAVSWLAAGMQEPER